MEGLPRLVRQKEAQPLAKRARSRPQMPVEARIQDPGFTQGVTLAQKRMICACP